MASPHQRCAVARCSQPSLWSAAAAPHPAELQAPGGYAPAQTALALSETTSCLEGVPHSALAPAAEKEAAQILQDDHAPQ